MVFKLSSILVIAAVLLAAPSQAVEFNLRGNVGGEDFSCSVTGAASEDVCDATKSSDGSSCVWCSMNSFGMCVSQTQAEAMKKAIPNLQCDSAGDDDDDDDDAAIDDDATGNDDDSTADDDAVPDDYWKCMKDYNDAKDCSGAGCTWCVSSSPQHNPNVQLCPL